MSNIAELGFKVESDPLVTATERADKLTPAVDKAERATDRFNKTNGSGRKSVDNLASGTENLRNQINRLAAGLAVATGILALANGVVNLTNTWTDLNSRVEIASGSIGQGTAVMQRLSEMARRTYSSLELTTESYLRNATAMRQLGYSTNETLDYVEAINNALVVSGAKGERAASVLDALGKAMALGKLSGDQLETVLASGGRVAEALADSLGVTTLELRKLGAEGKLTGAVLQRGLTSQLEKLRAEADAMPATIGDAFVLLGNSILETVGKMDQATGASGRVAEAIIFVADNTDLLVAGISGLAVVITVALIPAIISATSAMAAFTVALLANPLTWLALAAGAATTAIIAFTQTSRDMASAVETSNKAVASTSEAMAAAEASSKGYSVALRDQVAASIEATKAAMTLAEAEFSAALARQASFRAMTGGLLTFKPFTEQANAASMNLRIMDEALGKLEGQLATINSNLLPQTTANLDTMSASATKAAEAYRDIVTEAKNFIAEQNLTIETLGMSEVQINSLKYAQDLLNKATADGRTVTEAQRAELTSLGSEMARTEGIAKQLSETYNFYKQTFAGFFQNFRQDIMNGTSLWDSFRNAASKALDSIADRALSMAANGIFDMIFGAVTSGLTGGGRGLKLGFQTGVPGFATGGYTGNTGTGQAAGVVHGQEYVMNAQATRSIGVSTLNAMNSTGSTPANDNGGFVYQDNRSYVFGEGMSREDIEEIMAADREALLAEIPNIIQSYQADPRKRRAKG